MASFQDSDLGPIYNVEKTENGYLATMGYTAEMINEMARRVNVELDDEIMKRLGLVRPIRCRDCERYSLDDYGCAWCNWVCAAVQPDDFCAWGERRDA